jgi:4-carboxymuconolactone decarboxylase
MTGSNPRVAPDLVREHAAKLADLTDDVLFADVWQRTELSPRDRSLITVAALVALGRDAQLPGRVMALVSRAAAKRARPAVP